MFFRIFENVLIKFIILWFYKKVRIDFYCFIGYVKRNINVFINVVIFFIIGYDVWYMYIYFYVSL